MQSATHARTSRRIAGVLPITLALLCLPQYAAAQQQAPPTTATGEPQNTPQSVQKAEGQVERVVKRWRIGVQGGVALDPQLLDVGVHGEIGPLFSPNFQFRPVLEIGAGEITTMLAINLDFVYLFPSATTDTMWMPYVGAGPTFGLSHQSIDVEDNLVTNAINSDRNRFDFSDTDFDSGMNFIVGMRRRSGAFFEMKATAWGVSNVRLLAGFNF
jgi:hypothetical protein